MASVRPIIGRALPRQGIPPPIESWTEFAADLDWGQASGSMTSAGQWWWELRPHPLHGTLELRVPDAQATIADVTAITAVVHSLVAWLAARADAGDLPDDPPTWRIEENRWSAARHGAAGTMADFATGEQTPTATRLERLLAELAPVAGELGCADELRAADELVAGNGSDRQRAAVAAAGEVRAAVSWLADVFLPPDP
jgi:carboxylate-amine ligase